MKIAVLSGKGGSGKTTFSLLISHVLLSCAGHHRVYYLDCDCEAPNGHIFLDPKIEGSETKTVDVPRIQEDLCDYCGLCRDICRFKAITVFDRVVLTFPEMCHSCGGCFMVCPKGAVKEAKRAIGEVRWGTSQVEPGIGFFEGRIRVGEAMSPPLIKAVMEKADSLVQEDDAMVVIDSPPGTSCPAVTVLRSASFAVLVGEPTPFGVHDLDIMASVVKELGIPFGIVINKWRSEENLLKKWCDENHVEIIGKVPFSMELAMACSKGEAPWVILHKDPIWQKTADEMVEICSGNWSV